MSSAPTLAPEAAVRGLCWTRAAMHARESWCIRAPDALADDARSLERWAGGVADPVAELRPGSVPLVAVPELAAVIARELDEGTGVAWVKGLGSLPEQTLRLVYLAVGLELGRTIDTYGRLYDVRDRGVSYREQAVPVSQTRESTGFHTDSSGKSVCPRVVGLACVRQAPSGGGSRLVSAAEVHEQLRRERPESLRCLYRAFVRDIVTPQGDRSPLSVLDNAFPIFSYGRRLMFRYMRYWIERGHERAQLTLGDEEISALDALDAALTREDNILSIHLTEGDLLFIDNTTIGHDRDAYDEDPAQPRLMLRLWLDRNPPV